MKLYVGTVTEPGEWHVDVQYGDGLTAPLTHRVKHSPDGFAWGYNGAGPNELARCLLIDATGDQDPDPVLVLRYRRQVIALLDKDTGFRISQHSVLSWWRNQAEPDE